MKFISLALLAALGGCAGGTIGVGGFGGTGGSGVGVGISAPVGGPAGGTPYVINEGEQPIQPGMTSSEVISDSVIPTTNSACARTTPRSGITACGTGPVPSTRSAYSRTASSRTRARRPIRRATAPSVDVEERQRFSA